MAALRRFDPKNKEHVHAHDVLMHEGFNTQPARNAELRAMTGTDGIYFLCEGDEPVATINAQRCGQYVSGKVLPCWMVAAVAVRKHRRGKGVGSVLWAALFKEAARLKIPLVTLYPNNLPFYRSVGFELSAIRIKYKADAEAFAAAKEKSPIKVTRVKCGKWRATQGFLPVWKSLEKAYGAHAQGSNGLIRRNDYLWSKKLAADKGLAREIYIFGSKENPQGYAACEYREDRIFVTDWVALTPAAMQALRVTLAGLRHKNKQVVWFGSPVDPLVLALPEHGFPESRYCVEEQAWLMSRVIDVKRSLLGRGYRNVSGKVSFSYNDPLLPAQSGIYELTLKNGRPSVKMLERKPKNCLRLNPRALVMCISGIMPLKGAALFAADAPWCADQY